VNSIVDWIGHDWIWPLVLVGILVYYVRRNMRRAPDACREVTGEDCALDTSPTAGVKDGIPRVRWRAPRQAPAPGRPRTRGAGGGPAR